jgi:glyoxylase-like metal-dependent hydrolase (beta-lactamase superfamily II)
MSSPVLFVSANPGPMTLDGTNTWLLDGREPALIDAGIGDPAQVDALAAHLDGRRLARVLLTHAHADHAAGVGALRQRWPAVEICRWDEEPRAGAVRDGDWIAAGDGRLQAVHTPGHAPDHLCFWDPVTRGLFAGDMVIHGTTVMIPAKGGNLRAYLASLERLAALEPARIFPGHGAIIEHPLEAIRIYQRHRREREDQVRACLAEGVTSVEDIVARLYRGLPGAVLPAARQTIQAHLDKLAEDATPAP